MRLESRQGFGALPCQGALRAELRISHGAAQPSKARERKLNPDFQGKLSKQSAQLRAMATAVEESQPGAAETNDNRAQHTKAVLFDMDGVLCNSEELSQRTGVIVLDEIYGIKAEASDFTPFAGTGEANFLGGVAKKHGVNIDIAATKRRYFELYLETASRPDYKIGYAGATDMVRACKQAGLKTAVASSADRVKVDANLKAAGFDAGSDFDVIISADKFELLKPAPDIFLAAAQALGIHPDNCVVIEDAAAGVQAAKAAGMRCIGVTTSLTEEAMISQSPDAIYPQIGQIHLHELLSLHQQPQKLVEGLLPESQVDSESPKWLEEIVDLPGGRKTRRRELLKLFPLAGFLGSAFALTQNQQALTYVSPKALIKALLPSGGPPEGQADTESDRTAAFVRYIAEKERRGGLEEVPEFPAGLTWFNSSPLSLGRELKGKVLVYDFWTYCCINCIHVLPALAGLEKRYAGQPFTIVGVHSAKFDNEKDDENIRNAIMRYEISHPCVNDSGMVLWRDLGISSWPTLAVISPTGKLIATLPGEGQEGVVDSFLQAALSYYGDKGLLNNAPLPLQPEQDKDSRLTSSPLRYPGKLAADIPGDRVFIADSNNNRIVITTLGGDFVDQIGGGGPLLQDGDFQQASFSRPQGLAYASSTQTLYVADTENHALRKVDLQTRQVETLAGNGQKGSDYMGGGRDRNQQLNSPWDLVLDSEEASLYIALAGQHQIWRHDIASGETRAFSGDGAERNANGSSARNTSWAQPSGLALSDGGDSLIVADSESSCIRKLSLHTGGSQAIVGGDPIFSDNLFRFGNQDGQGSEAKLQHPLAVCSLGQNTVLVADSYNHSLKVVDVSRNTIKTVAGCGKAGFADGRGVQAALSEPAGLALGPHGSVIVADTNNQVLRLFDPASQEVRTMQLQGFPPPRQSAPEGRGLDIPPGAQLVSVEPTALSNGVLRVKVSLPDGYHLTQGANSRFEIATDKPGAIALEPAAGPLHEQEGTAVAEVQFRRSSAARAQLSTRVYYCLDGGVCLLQENVFQMRFLPDVHSKGDVFLNYSIRAQAPQGTL